MTFGETMVRDTPVDNERPERTRTVHLSMAGSELTLAMGLSLDPIEHITRVPANPTGLSAANVARENGICTDHRSFGRPRRNRSGASSMKWPDAPEGYGIYQRAYSAASRLDAGMVAWEAALKDCRLFHTSGITFGLSTHSGYAWNYLLATFEEAIQHKPAGAWSGWTSFNGRRSGSVEQARR